MWVVGGVDLPLPDEDVSAFGELVGADAHVGGHREDGAAIAGDAPAELAKSFGARGQVLAAQCAGQGADQAAQTCVTWSDARAVLEFARRPEDVGGGVARAG
jgi:hypothetical protein